MPIYALLRWKLIADLDTHTVDRLRTLFNESSGKGFVRTLGGRTNLAFSPRSLSPTNRFYDLLWKNVTGVRGPKLPFSYDSKGAEGSRSVNLQFRLYGVSTLVIDVGLEPFEVRNHTD